MQLHKNKGHFKNIEFACLLLTKFECIIIIFFFMI